MGARKLYNGCVASSRYLCSLSVPWVRSSDRDHVSLSSRARPRDIACDLSSVPVSPTSEYRESEQCDRSSNVVVQCTRQLDLHHLCNTLDLNILRLKSLQLHHHHKSTMSKSIRGSVVHHNHNSNIPMITPRRHFTVTLNNTTLTYNQVTDLTLLLHIMHLNNNIDNLTNSSTWLLDQLVQVECHGSVASTRRREQEHQVNHGQA